MLRELRFCACRVRRRPVLVGFRLAVGTKATVEEKEEKKACSSGGETGKHTLSHIHTLLKPKGDFLSTHANTLPVNK